MAAHTPLGLLVGRIPGAEEVVHIAVVAEEVDRIAVAEVVRIAVAEAGRIAVAEADRIAVAEADRIVVAEAGHTVAGHLVGYNQEVRH